MPKDTWRSYATKVRKKPKSDFREYTHGSAVRSPRETSCCDRLFQSREIQEEKEEIVIYGKKIEITEDVVYIGEEISVADILPSGLNEELFGANKMKAKKAKLGSGARFKAIEKKAAASGAENPSAVAAAVGMKKYGKKKMESMAAAGKKRKSK